MPLKTKDLMTIGNIYCGILSVLYIIQGNLVWASYLILLAWIFDALDGSVANLLKQANKFGGEFDNVADLIAYSMSPTFLVWAFFIDRLPFWVVLPLASLPLTLGCVRFARFNVKRIYYPGVWIGYPRPASALMIVGILNSHLVQAQFPFFPDAGLYVAAIVVAVSSLGNLGLIPFMSHHGKIKPHVAPFMWFLLITLVIGLATDAILFFDPLAPLVGLTWDIITIWLVLYAFVHRFLVWDMAELHKIKDFTRAWLAEEKQELAAGH